MLGNKGTREYLADKMCNLKKLKFFDIIFIENKNFVLWKLKKIEPIDKRQPTLAVGNSE